MATKSFTNDVTFEPKDVDNLIKALETDKKPNPIKNNNRTFRNTKISGIKER